MNLCVVQNQGRDCDKDKEAGLTPYYVEGTTTYEEADLVCCMQEIVCTANEAGIFHGEMDRMKNGILRKDYHTMYLERNRKSSCRE